MKFIFIGLAFGPTDRIKRGDEMSSLNGALYYITNQIITSINRCDVILIEVVMNFEMYIRPEIGK